MEIGSLEILKETLVTVKDFIAGLTADVMKVTFSTTNDMDKEHLISPTALSTEALFGMEKDQARVLIPSQTETPTREAGRMANMTAMASLHGTTVEFTEENGASPIVMVKVLS
mmetsp:Transcript_46258/g.133260  ORF Transcript_46258/g.133260 Transcript_46258/m.133260 type:complete len:113 (-) Transcript_46258:451-789(-)